MKRIKNPWFNPHSLCSKEFFTVSQPVFTYKTGAIYKLGKQDYLFTDNDRAFNELAGLNKDHLKAVIDRIDNGSYLYKNAVETLTQDGEK